MRAILTTDHEIPDRPPLSIRAGDLVQIGERDTQWPAFVFVTAPQGTGWVPSRHIDIDGAVGVVRVAYDTTELPGAEGEHVEIVRDDPESGWSWCRNGSGREGWIPHRALTME